MCVLYKTLRPTFDVKWIEIATKVLSLKKSITPCLKWIIEEQRLKRDAISSNLATKLGKGNIKRFKCCWIK